MTSSTATSNPLISSLSRSSPTTSVTSPTSSHLRHRSVTSHRVRSSSSSHHHHHGRVRLTGSHSSHHHNHRLMMVPTPTAALPVDLNNNNTVTNLTIPDSVLRVQNGQQQQQQQTVLLDRVAILKAFSGKNSGSTTESSAECNNRLLSATSRFEKPTTAREARQRLRLQRHGQLAVGPQILDPEVEQEFVRLRESVPSIAGSNVSDLTIINEAISLICDLESQLIRKLKNQQLQTSR